MSKNYFKPSSGELEIFAVSDSISTYLLPSFFKLSSRQQALILIHESNIRKGETLETTMSDNESERKCQFLAGQKWLNIELVEISGGFCRVR